MAISDMGIAQIREGLASKQFTACEVAQASLDRIAQADSQVHAFLEVTSEAAMAAAQRVDQAIADGTFDTLGPLAGVPVAFKDNMNMTGTHTTCSSRMLENYVSPYTATCVQRIIDAGGVPLGKLNMDEFAFGSTTESSAFGPTRNPWDLGRVPGGSSGGSAAAVAAGMACVTLGSDTGGSIRQPASFCGIVGVKPTYGTVSRYGVVAFGSSLDQVGPFARSVEDAAAAMDALCGHDPLDCTSQDVKAGFRAACQQDVAGMRVGVVRSFMDAKGLSSEVSERVSEAAAKLEAAGATIVEVDLPHMRCRHQRLLRAGPVRGVLQPGPLRQRALRLLRGRSQGPGRPVRGKPSPWLRRRGEAPHHAGQLPAFRRRVRAVLLSGPAGPHAHHAGLPQRLRAGAIVILAPTAPRHGVQVRRDRRSGDHVPVRRVHHLHQHRRQRRHERAGAAWARKAACPWACSSSPRSSRTRTCSAPPWRSRPPTARPPWPRTSPTGR